MTTPAVDAPTSLHPFEEERTTAEERLVRTYMKALRLMKRKVVDLLTAQAAKEGYRQKALDDVLSDRVYQSLFEEELLDAVSHDASKLMFEGVGQVETLGLSVNFDLVNEHVLDMSGRYAYDVTQQLESSTTRQLQKAIQGHIAVGAPLSQLINDIEPIFGRKRAETIAVTEVTRLYSEGNRAAYAASGVEVVEWRSVMDSKVDPLCHDLHGQRWLIGHEDFVPPRHSRCRCFLAPVVDGSPLTGGGGGRPRGEFTGKINQGRINRLTKRMNEEFRLEDRAELTRTFEDLIDTGFANGGGVFVRVDQDTLASILFDGRIKSQFETGSSKGYFSPTVRSEAEDRLFNVGSMTPATKRPIYGYFSDEAMGYLDATGPSGWALGMYGNTAIKLKSGVATRTTITLGDSLDYGISEEWGLALPLTEVDYRLLAGQATSTGLRDIKRAGTVTSLLEVRGQGYIEAQIHNGVALSDIERLVFDQEPIPALKKLLEINGIPYEVIKAPPDYAD